MPRGAVGLDRAVLRRAAILLPSVLVLLAGCGNSRTPVPSLSHPAGAGGFRTLSYPALGVSFRAPRNWTIVPGQAPLVTVVTSGSAIVALWRFHRTAQPPAGASALRRDRIKLIGAARARDASLQVIRSKVVRIGRARAIELDAIERIGGQLRRVRSTHVFLTGAELVLEEYAPPDLFHAVDHSVFSPLKRSLHLSPLPAG